MHDQKDNLENLLTHDKLATQKDLRILELELSRKMEMLNTELKSSLLRVLGSLIVSGFGILGYLVIWFKH